MAARMATPSPALPGVFKISVNGSRPSAEAGVQTAAYTASMQALKRVLCAFIFVLCSGLSISARNACLDLLI